MAKKLSTQSDKTDGSFRLYASPVGAGFLQKANKIFEDFPASKYILFFVIITIEVIIAFWLGLHLIG